MTQVIRYEGRTYAQLVKLLGDEDAANYITWLPMMGLGEILDWNATLRRIELSVANEPGQRKPHDRR